MMNFSIIFEGSAYRNAGKILMTLLMTTMLFACATAEQKRASHAQQEAYKVAIARGINAHVYEMSCQAVLPVAEEILIKRGYTTQVYDQEGLIVEMQWKEDAQAARSRFIAQGMALGEQRCNLQIVAEKETAGQRTAQRSDEIEMELISRIQPEMAKNIKAQAKAMSDQVYEQSLQQQTQQTHEGPAVREVNDQPDTEILPEQL